MSDYLDKLSTFVAETDYACIPEPALRAGRLILLDTIGGMLAGSTLPELRAFARSAAAASPAPLCTLAGQAERASPAQAAMVNATAACSFETDEGNRFGGGHPAIHVVPAALAAAEARNADGRQLLTALIVAYEAMSRLAAGATPRWPVHSHGTHGSPGSAIAALMYLRPDAARVRRVLNLAACMTPATSWQACFDGANVRNLWPGLSSLLGLLAVELEAAGFAGADDGPAAIFGPILGQGGYDRDRVLDGLGEDWRVTRNYFKLHYACAYTHPPLDAIFALLARRPFVADEVERISVYGPTIAAQLAGFAPRTMLAAKFNIPYCLAAAVVRRSAGIESFLDDARADAAINALAARVVVFDDPTRAPIGFGDRGRTLVSVQFHDGAVLHEEVALARGDAANPVEPEVLLAKFRDLAARCLPAARVERLLDRILNIDALAGVAELCTELRP